jgi:hypothetical protein
MAWSKEKRYSLGVYPVADDARGESGHPSHAGSPGSGREGEDESSRHSQGKLGMETFTRTVNALCEKETYRNDKDIWKGIATLLIYLYLCLMKQELVQQKIIIRNPKRRVVISG